MGRRTSYRDFLARIDRAALALYTAGIRAGDRVTIFRAASRYLWRE
jgi:long-subunit acyl-CoA synthetase (AMP-forming)